MDNQENVSTDNHEEENKDISKKDTGSEITAQQESDLTKEDSSNPPKEGTSLVPEVGVAEEVLEKEGGADSTTGGTTGGVDTITGGGADTTTGGANTGGADTTTGGTNTTTGGADTTTDGTNTTTGEADTTTTTTGGADATTGGATGGADTTTTGGEDTETDHGDEKNPSSSDGPRDMRDDSKHSSSSSSSTREGRRSHSSREKKRERRRKKHSSPVPKLRRKTSKIGNAAEHYLQFILRSYFQAFDPLNSGLVSYDHFWNILLSAELNLQLNQVDMQMIQTHLPFNEHSQILYAEFVTTFKQLMSSIYGGQPDTESNEVEIRSYDGSIVVSYNKKTGEVIDKAESGIEVLEETFRNIFNEADVESKGYITSDQFAKVLETEDFSLNPQDKEEVLKIFPGERASYSEFEPTAKEVVLRLYRARDPSSNEWTQVNTVKIGSFWLNKLTGETRRNAPIMEEREQEAALINQAYSQIDTLNMQLEQEKSRTRELENQVAIANEELEGITTQLDETGRQLDEVNLELQLRETEVSQLQSIIVDKDQYIDELVKQATEVTDKDEKLARAKTELEETKRQLLEKDALLAGKDQTIDDLNLQSGAIIEQLKNAHGVIDARESSIGSLQYNLTNEQGKVSFLKQQMPSLEVRLTERMDELIATKKSLDEKNAILLQTRESLKKARAKNTELEKENSKFSEVCLKLKNAECEIRTLKNFLTSKTAMVERRKKEIQELKFKLAEMEGRDTRRAIILADVLEKTARTVQQQLTTSPRQHPDPHHIPNITSPPESSRPLSAPLIPLEEVVGHDMDPLSLSYQAPPSKDMGHHLPEVRSTGRKKRGHIKARSVPRLPPIRKRKSSFVVPTAHEVKQSWKEKDKKIHPHTSSVNCQCEMCILNKRGPMDMAYSVSDDSGAALSRLRLQADQKEYQLSKQLKNGMRVLVQIKKSAFDLEPQKLTGIVKYVGKVDSEYLDNKIYVGVKLDDPVGNTDGLYKGRRYFTCPPCHGRMVRITSVLAVRPNKCLTYVPLQIGPNAITATSSPYRLGQQHRELQYVT